MNNKRFNWLVEQRCETIKKVLLKKAEEYAGDEERLHNFKIAGRKRAITPEEALMGMKLKHTVSLEDIVDGINKGKIPNEEMFLEKITDEINYWILLEALVTERIEQTKTIKPF